MVMAGVLILVKKIPLGSLLAILLILLDLSITIPLNTENGFDRHS